MFKTFFVPGIQRNKSKSLYLVTYSGWHKDCLSLIREPCEVGIITINLRRRKGSLKLNGDLKVTEVLGSRARIKPRVFDTKSRVLPTGAPASKKPAISSMAGYCNHGKILHSLPSESVHMVTHIRGISLPSRETKLSCSLPWPTYENVTLKGKHKIFKNRHI